MKKLDKKFYEQDALLAAPRLLGKILVRKTKEGIIHRIRICETEAYCGEEDKACHAKAGRTSRTEVLYMEGGHAYVYLCYGIHSLFNVVVGKGDEPQAVLIRAGISDEGIRYDGPGKLAKAMAIDRSLDREDMRSSDCLWIEDDGAICDYKTSPRIGINSVPEPYKSMEWRFVSD